MNDVKSPKYANCESEFTYAELRASLFYVDAYSETLKVSIFTLINYLQNISNRFEEEVTKHFNVLFSSDRLDTQAWHILRKKHLESDEVFDTKSLESKKNEEKVYYFLNFLSINAKHTLFRWIAEIHLESDLTSSKLNMLYTLAQDLGVSRKDAVKTLKAISTHSEEVYRMINGMTSRAKILSYLYTVLTFIKSGNHIDGIEKKALQDLKKSYGIDYDDKVFWTNYLDIIEGRSEGIVFDDIEAEIAPFLAALTLLCFEDNEIHPNELNCILPILKRFNKDKSYLKETAFAYRDIELKDILNGISFKGLIYLLINCLHLSWTDKRVTTEEFGFFKTLTTLIKEKNKVTDNADELYIIFLQILFENPDFCLRNEGKDAKAMNKFMTSVLSLSVPIRTILFFIETFLNAKGIQHDKKTLLTILSTLDIDDVEKTEIISDCLESNSDESVKRLMLLAIMKLEYVLKNDSDENMIETIVDIIEQLPEPSDFEKSSIVFFIMKAILLDRSIENEEKEYFEDLALKINADQDLIRKFSLILFLETAVKFDFDGWHDYKKYKEELKTRLLK